MLYSPLSKLGPFCCSVSGSSPSLKEPGLESRRCRTLFPQTTTPTTTSAATYRACLTGRKNTVAGSSGRGVSCIVWRGKGRVFSRWFRQLHTKIMFRQISVPFRRFQLGERLKNKPSLFKTEKTISTPAAVNRNSPATKSLR